MKGLTKSKIYISLMVLFILGLVFPNINALADTDKQQYEMKVSYGIEGNYRSMKYIPVSIEVNSLEADFNGDIEVRVQSGIPGYYDAYSTKVTLNKGETTVVNIPVKVPEGSSKVTVNLMDGKKSVYETKVLVSKGRVSEGNLFAGILTDDATALGYLGDVKHNFSNGGIEGGKISTVKLTADILAENSLNIDGLDLIFINNYNMANFKKEHYDALSSWINRGGKLIIGSGANESKTVNVIDKDFLDVNSSGVKSENVVIKNESLDLILSQLSIKDATVKENSSNKELLYSVQKGRGEILVATFDLGLEPFTSSKVASEFWETVLSTKFEELYNKGNIYGNSGFGYYGAQELIKNIPVDKIVSTTTLAIILALYALIIGFVLYIVLKKINKRDLTWIVIPAMAVIFSLTIYLVGSKNRVKDIILNQVNLVSVNTDGRATAKGYLGIATKYKKDIIIEKPQDIAMNYLTNDYYYGMQSENSNNNRLRVKTTFENNNSYFTFDDSDALEMKKFEVSGKELVMEKVEGSFNLDGGSLNGSMVNNLDYDISKVILVAGQNVWDLGPVKKGEELKVEGVGIKTTLGLQAYADIIMQDYYNARWSDKTKLESDEFKGISRMSNLLGTVGTEMTVSDKPKVIAITDIPVEYDIEFGKNSISKYDTTAIISEITIDFKDKEGNVNFPEGYFAAELNSSSKNVSVDMYGGYIYGEGDIVFDYKIDEAITPLEITVKPGTDRYGYSGGNTSEIYVYNFVTKEYEKISLAANFHKLNNASDYLEDNTFRIKMEVSDYKGGGMIPKIAVKGREK